MLILQDALSQLMQKFDEFSMSLRRSKQLPFSAPKAEPSEGEMRVTKLIGDLYFTAGMVDRARTYYAQVKAAKTSVWFALASEGLLKCDMATRCNDADKKLTDKKIFERINDVAELYNSCGYPFLAYLFFTETVQCLEGGVRPLELVKKYLRLLAGEDKMFALVEMSSMYRDFKYNRKVNLLTIELSKHVFEHGDSQRVFNILGDLVGNVKGSGWLVMKKALYMDCVDSARSVGSQKDACSWALKTLFECRDAMSTQTQIECLKLISGNAQALITCPADLEKIINSSLVSQINVDLRSFTETKIAEKDPNSILLVSSINKTSSTRFYVLPVNERLKFQICFKNPLKRSISLGNIHLLTEGDALVSANTSIVLPSECKKYMVDIEVSAKAETTCTINKLQFELFNVIVTKSFPDVTVKCISSQPLLKVASLQVEKMQKFEGERYFRRVARTNLHTIFRASLTVQVLNIGSEAATSLLIANEARIVRKCDMKLQLAKTRISTDSKEEIGIEFNCISSLYSLLLHIHIF